MVEAIGGAILGIILLCIFVVAAIGFFFFVVIPATIIVVGVILALPTLSGLVHRNRKH